MTNWNFIEGSWTELKGEIRQLWGKLTDDELEQVAGNRVKLLGKLQEKYGWTREEAEQHVEAFANKHQPETR